MSKIKLKKKRRILWDEDGAICEIHDENPLSVTYCDRDGVEAYECALEETMLSKVETLKLKKADRFRRKNEDGEFINKEGKKIDEDYNEIEDDLDKEKKIK